MRYLKSKRGLKVKALGNSIYLAWIPNYFGLIPPKLQYKHELNGELELLGVRDQIRAIAVNAGISSLVILLFNYLENGYIDLKFIYPLIIGVIGFFLILNFLLVEVTKWKVAKQK